MQFSISQIIRFFFLPVTLELYPFYLHRSPSPISNLFLRFFFVLSLWTLRISIFCRNSLNFIFNRPTMLKIYIIHELGCSCLYFGLSFSLFNISPFLNSLSTFHFPFPFPWIAVCFPSFHFRFLINIINCCICLSLSDFVGLSSWFPAPDLVFLQTHSYSISISHIQSLTHPLNITHILSVSFVKKRAIPLLEPTPCQQQTHRHLKRRINLQKHSKDNRSGKDKAH